MVNEFENNRGSDNFGQNNEWPQAGGLEKPSHNTSEVPMPPQSQESPDRLQTGQAQTNQAQNIQAQNIQAQNNQAQNDQAQNNQAQAAHGLGNQQSIQTQNDNRSQMKDLDKPKKKSNKLLYSLVILALLLGGAFLAYLFVGSKLDPGGTPGDEIALDVPSGSTAKDLAALLEENEVIPSASGFEYYSKYKKIEFDAGTYTFQKNSSVYDVRDVLDGGEEIERGDTFIVREGEWMSEVLPQLIEQFPNITEEEFKEALNNKQANYRPADLVLEESPGEFTNWEGLLFPSTYEYPPGITAVGVIDLMHDTLVEKFEALKEQYPERLTEYSEYELLIIASMIEAESKVNDEKGKVARVMYNRLEDPNSGANGRLQIDATSIYGVQERTEAGNIITSYKGVYETRTSTGIPPTPIGTIGEASLEAAFNPEPGDWVFYVLKDKAGNHLFTADIDEFNNQKNKSIAEGIFKN